MSTDSLSTQETGTTAVSTATATKRRQVPRTMAVWALRALILAAFLLAWQYLPTITWLREHYRFLDPFFISSPDKVAHRIWAVTATTHSQNGSIVIWPYLWNTVKATFAGFAIGLVSGVLVGVALSSSRLLAEVVRPFIVALNTIPRIALIPIIVVIAGVGFTAVVINAVLVVFFLIFFAAFEGGTNVPSVQLANAQIIGASRTSVMLKVRLPYVFQWVFAALPNAISFGLLVVVTTELLTGIKGMGSLLFYATTNLDATLTLTLAVLLSIVGVIIVGFASVVQRRVLHWAAE
jgi:NitT/TauT family transport system permease protein